jgi:glutathione S-transferase
MNNSSEGLTLSRTEIKKRAYLRAEHLTMAAFAFAVLAYVVVRL